MEWYIRDERLDALQRLFRQVHTNFAPLKYSPPWPGVDIFKGTTVHTSRWPQEGMNLDGQRVAVIGTGATGVQTIQEVSQKASHLTVFQRTPNTALPMTNPVQTASLNRAMREGFAETKKKMETTFAGFDYEFNTGKAQDFSKEERMQLYEQLYHAGKQPSAPNHIVLYLRQICKWWEYADFLTSWG